MIMPHSILSITEMFAEVIFCEHVRESIGVELPRPVPPSEDEKENLFLHELEVS